MATEIVIDNKQYTAFIKRTGLIKPGEMLQGTKDIISDPSFAEIRKSLSDISTADFSDISADEFEWHARYCREKFTGIKVAIVAPRDDLFGITRRFEILSDMKELLVTRDVNEALSWLDIALPEDF